MRHSAAKHLAATVLILALGGAAKADINITQWDLRQHVREGTGLGEDWILHSEVTLPVFEFEHTATHLGSTSTGTYTFDVDATGNAATFAFTTEKARGEMEADGLSAADVVESIVNAQAIMKTLRSRSQAKRYAGEKLYVIKSFSYDGTLIYTKGAIVRQGKREVFYVFVSAKIATLSG